MKFDGTALKIPCFGGLPVLCILDSEIASLCLTSGWIQNYFGISVFLSHWENCNAFFLKCHCLKPNHNTKIHSLEVYLFLLHKHSDMKSQNIRVQKVFCLSKCHDFKQIVEGFSSLEYYTSTALTQGNTVLPSLAWETWTERCHMTLKWKLFFFF